MKNKNKASTHIQLYTQILIILSHDKNSIETRALNQPHIIQFQILKVSEVYLFT